LAALGFLLVMLATRADVMHEGWNVTGTTTTTEQFATRNLVLGLGSGDIAVTTQ